MKLFHKLLVAPAAIGMLAPVAANAAEINFNGITEFAPAATQAQEGFGFSDLHPTDWGFKALKNVHQSRGCKAVMPKGTMTRFEAASLLNACLVNAPSLNEEEQKLVEEFGSELAQIRGTDIDGSAAYDIYAGEFSSTTTIGGEANFTTGAADIDSNNNHHWHSIYSYKLNVNTSFSGEDALVTGFETGNADSNTRILSDAVVAGSDHQLAVSNLYYTRPLGSFMIGAGPMYEKSALVGATTSTYDNKGLFSGWNYGPNALSNDDWSGSPGAGIAWVSDGGFNAGISLQSAEGSDDSKGILSENGLEVTTYSFGYDAEKWGGGFLFTQYENPTSLLTNVRKDASTNIAGSDVGTPGITGIGAYWLPTDKLDVSLGVDWIDLSYVAVVSGSEVAWETATSWSLGADYDLDLGTLSAGVSNIPSWNYETGAQDDAGTAYEVYFSYPATDGLTIRPMIMFHALDKSGPINWADETIYAVETTFSF